ncbi:MAG: Hsp33 family molecular chaperone HslO, partial [Limnobacter sp.]|nr:Hsp33 family molecular chaperone HslO [Limnobacter sp.]
RAQMVQMHHAWHAVSTHNECPPPVQKLLGELVAATALLSASLKFEGSLIIQLQGDGPVQLLIAECNNTLGIRATLKMQEGAEVQSDASFKDMVNQTGKGLCVLILDPKNRQRGQQPYQGIVALDGDSVGQALEAYMRNSEQLETRLMLWSSNEAVAGILLQQMPKSGGKNLKNHDPNGWETANILAETAKEEEMLTLDTETMSRRLFLDMNPEVLADREPHFFCTCSRNKVSRMLINLGEKEVQEALKEHPHISVHCDFCNTAYLFTQNQCEKLFSNDDDLDPPPEDIEPGQDPSGGVIRDGKPPTLH